MKTKGNASYVSFHRHIRNGMLSVLMAVVLLTIDSCKSENGDPGPAQAAGCTLVSQTTHYSGRESATVTFTYIAKFGYTYDAQGNQTATTVTYDYTYSDGTTELYTGSTSNQFDGEGFLLRSVNQSNRTERNKSTSFSNYNVEYTYDNKRLIKSTAESTSSGYPKQTYNYLYEYNSDGNLSKFTNANTNEFTTVEYNGNAIKKVTKVDAKGNSSTPFFEYNSKGLLTKWIETGSGYTEEYRYEYDGNGQETRRERYINGKTSSANTVEYDNKPSPYVKQYPTPKGHPSIPSLYSNAANINNVTRYTNYEANAAGTGWEPSGSSLNVYDYNASGFPTVSMVKGFDKNGAQTSSSSSVFEYKDCQ